MDMHGIIFDVDDTRDDMAQPFSEHIKSSMESDTHFDPPMFDRSGSSERRGAYRRRAAYGDFGVHWKINTCFFAGKLIEYISLSGCGTVW